MERSTSGTPIQPPLGYHPAMSINLLPDHWPLLQPGETISARLTQAQLSRAMTEAKAAGMVFAVEPQRHYWLTVLEVNQ